nr:unnamed protein product [Digitaria exilis]
MGGSNTDRARKAVDAMKLLGFSRKQSVPVLKKLLSIFNDNWEPIEDECYRTLADAILDAQDNNQAPASQQGTQAAHVDLESHGTTRDASADEEDNETPLVKRPRMGAAQFGQQLQPGPRQCSVSTQGALPASPQTSRRQTRSLTANYGDPSAIGDALILKEPKPDPDVNASQGKACQAVPKAIHLNAGSSGAGVRRSTVNQPQNLDSSLQAVPLGNNGVGSTVENTKEASFVEVDVASSTNGEVKMTLKCNLDSSELSYSMEEVLKMVEEKCFHSYKMLPPDFSIGKLMTEVFFTSEGKGWGLRTLEDLPKGAFVCEYAGEVLTNTELYARAIENARNGKHMHQVLLDADWGSEGELRDEEALGLDGTFYGNVGRFINHRCYDANLVQIPVEVETPDHHYYHLAFFTTKKVEPFEELTWDYGIDFGDVDGPRRMSRAAARQN